MAFAEYEIGLTKHAHEQYEKRVEAVTKTELKQLLVEQVGNGEYYRDREYIRLDGVWWVFEIREGVMVFITCYGRTHIDVPQALSWARKNKDRIHLTGGEVLCDV